MTTEPLNKALADAVNKLYDLHTNPRKIVLNEKKYYELLMNVLDTPTNIQFWGIPVEFGELAEEVDFVIMTDANDVLASGDDLSPVAMDGETE